MEGEQKTSRISCRDIRDLKYGAELVSTWRMKEILIVQAALIRFDKRAVLYANDNGNAQAIAA